MKIAYLVKAGMDYEGYDILHVASTEELAKKYLANIQRVERYDNYDIEEFEIDHDYYEAQK